MLPPPAVTLKLTVTFATGFPRASRTTTDGGLLASEPATPLCVTWESGNIDTAVPPVAVAVKVTGARAPAEAVNEFGPGVGPRIQAPTVAFPSAPVGTEPMTIAPSPDVTAKVT